MTDASAVGKRASARWAYPHDLSDVRAEGRILGYCDAPMVLIEGDDGERVWWRADLTIVEDDA
jgi:hypothetical protein